jgi:hypothetical protein
VHFLLVLGAFERDKLRLGQHQPLLGGFGFQCLQALCMVSRSWRNQMLRTPWGETDRACRLRSNCCATSANVRSPRTAASATFTLNAAECVRRLLYVIFWFPLPALCQAQIPAVPLIALTEFPAPPLVVMELLSHRDRNLQPPCVLLQYPKVAFHIVRQHHRYRLSVRLHCMFLPYRENHDYYAEANLMNTVD